MAFDNDLGLFQPKRKQGAFVEDLGLMKPAPVGDVSNPLSGLDFGQNGEVSQTPTGPTKGFGEMLGITPDRAKIAMLSLQQMPYITAEGLYTAFDNLSPANMIFGRDENRKYKTLYDLGLQMRAESQKLEQMKPEMEPGSVDYYINQVMGNLFQNSPWVVAGLLTGGSAVPIMAMSSVAAGTRYNDLMEAGYDHNQAFLASIGHGISEGFGELMSFNALMKFAKTGGMKYLLEYMIKEPASEIATELMQMSIELGYLQEDMSINQFLSRIKDVAIITGITSPLLGGFGRAAHYVGTGVQKLVSPEPGQQAPSTLPQDATLPIDTTKTIDAQTKTQQAASDDILSVDVNDKTLTIEDLQELETRYTEELDKETQSVNQGTLSAEWVLENFRGAKILEDLGEGQFRIELPNGKRGRVLGEDFIEIDRESALKNYSAEEIENGIAMGSVDIIDGEFVIKVVKPGVELPHEAYHLAERIALTEEELDAAQKEEPDPEARADGYNIFKTLNMEDRAKHPYFMKIMDFFGRINNFFQKTPTTRSIYRAIERGDVWERMAQTGETGEQYAIRNIRQIREDRKWRNWEPTITSTGKYRGAPEEVTDRKTLNGMRARIRKFVQEGLAGRYWYEESTRQVMAMVKGDIVKAEKFIQLLAIYSPNSNVWVNTIQAVKAYTHWNTGKSADTFKVGSEKTDAKAIAMLYRGEQWEGRKTNSFYENLMHELIVSYPKEISKLNLDAEIMDIISTPVTSDVWMFRAFGYVVHQAGGKDKEGKYSFTEKEIRRLTANINENLAPEEDRWSPHQVQAAIWTALKTRYELQDVKDKTTRKSEREHIIHKEGKKYVYPAKNTEASRMHYANWRHFALQPTSDEVRTAVEETARSFSDDLERMTETITWEANPSKSLKLEINNASPAVLQDFTAEARSLLMDENGNDLLAAQLGVAISYSANGFGAYAGGISPNSLAHLLPARVAGQDGFNTDEVRSYARAVQYIYKQDAVPWFRPDNKALSAGGEEDQKFRVIKVATGRVVNNGRFDTQEEAEALAKKKGDGYVVRGGDLAIARTIRFQSPLDNEILRSMLADMQRYLGEDAGFTRTTAQEIVIINYRNDKTHLPYKYDEDFIDEVNKFIDENGDKYGIIDHGQIHTQGEYGYEHDWSKDSEGENILGEIPLSERPYLHSWLRSRRDVFEELLDRYSGEGLKTAEQAARTRRTAYSIRNIRASDVAVSRRYGSPQEGSSSVLGFHYSKNPITALSGSYYGTGKTGKERERLAGASRELNNRIHFYVDTGDGVRPERGLGPNLVALNLDNVYDSTKDPDGIVNRIIEENGIDPAGEWFNKVEQAIIDAGYDGIYVPSAQSSQGVAVLIGSKHSDVSVEQIPEGQGTQYKIKVKNEVRKVHNAIRADKPNRTGREGKQNIDEAISDWQMQGNDTGDFPWWNYIKPMEFDTEDESVIETNGLEPTRIIPITRNEAKKLQDTVVLDGRGMPTPNVIKYPTRAQLNEDETLNRWGETNLEGFYTYDTKLYEDYWPTYTQYSIKSPEFKKWFGDSKVVDENGAPRVVYHGTDAEEDFKQFRKGSWFAEDPETAGRYVKSHAGGGPRIVPVYLKTENPLIIPDNLDMSLAYTAKEFFDGINKANDTNITPEDAGYNQSNDKHVGFTMVKDTAPIEAQGFDGIKAIERGKVTWTVFSPDQVKSSLTNYSIKSQFREATGQTPGPKTVREMEALRSGMTKAERASREAFRRGIATGRALQIQSKLANTKTRIRELTGQVRVKDLHANSLDVLNEVLGQVEKAAGKGERIGQEAGRMSEHERMTKLQQIKKNKEKLIKEARNLKRYLEAAIKKVDKFKMEPEYRDLTKIVASEWNADAIEKFMNDFDPTLVIDQNQIDMLRDSKKKSSLKGADETTLEELRNIVSIVKQIIVEGKNYRKITLGNKKFDLDETAAEIKASIEKNFDIMVPEPVDTKLEPSPDERPRMEQKPSKWQKIKDMCDASFNHLVKAEYFAEMLDGYKKMGKVWSSIIRPMVEAENHALARMIRYRARMDEALNLIRGDLRSIVTEKYMEINGEWITKENAIMIALNSIHPDNMRQLVYGNRISPRDVDRVVSSLTPNERQFVVEILDIINSQTDEMSDVYRTITGERMRLVEGIYFPIAVSKELNERINEADKIKNLLVDAVARASINRAMTISRLANTKNAVKLDFSVITDHLAATNLFITHGEAIRDVSRLLTHRDVKASITEALGENAYSQFQKWLKNIANPHYEALRGWDSAMGWLRRNSTTAILGYSLSVAVLQPSAIFSTINRLGMMKTMKGLSDFYLSGKHGEIMDDILAMSPFMYQRTQSFDLDIRRQLEEDTDVLWKTNKMKESFYWMIQFMDRMATAPTWWATYMDEMKQHGDQRVSILMADKMVRNTQGSASPKDLAEVQRGSNTRKAFVMFYTFFSAQFNEMNKSVDMVKMGVKGPQEIMRSFFWIMFMPALFSVLLKRREKLLEDDNVWWEMFKGTVGYGSSMIPVLGGIVNSLTEGFAYRPTALMSVPQEAIYAAQKLGKAVETGDNEEYYKMSKHLAMLLGYTFGLPSRQAILATDVALEYYEEGEADFGSLIYKQSKK